MARQLEQTKKLSRQFEKICRKLVEDAIKQLGSKNTGLKGKGVHNSRKRLKQVRGMLQLMRYGLPNKTFKRQDELFRRVAKPLSEIRDADVMIETLDKLSEHFQHQVKPKSFQKLRRALMLRRRNVRKQALAKNGEIKKIHDSLKDELDSLKKWTSIPDDYRILLKGMKQTYSTARDQMLLASEDNDTEELHEWRKHVKYLRYELQVLQTLSPPVISLMVDQTTDLSDLLGEDHDLAVLKELILNECRDCCNANERELLLALLNQRRTELETQALIEGRNFFVETPKQFRLRLKGYWKSSKADLQETTAA